MIQHMNNVLVKHSKVLFGLITIVIIVSFVWFLTPGADGSLFFSGGKQKVGRVFDTEDVTLKDMEAARDELQILAPVIPQLRGDLKEDSFFQFAAIKKIAVLKGYSISDEQLKNSIQKIFADEKGNFSAQQYKEFQDKFLVPRRVTCEQFENAFRSWLLIQEFSANAVMAVSVSENEVDCAIKNMAKRITVYTFTFDAKNYAAGIKPDATSTEAYYQQNIEDFQESAALVFYVKKSSVKVPEITEQQVKEAEEAGLYPGKDKDAIRKELIEGERETACRKTVSDFYRKIQLEVADTDEFKKDPAKVAKETAKTSGLETIEVSNLNQESPATDLTSAALIKAICALKEINSFTVPVPGDNGCAMAMLTGKKEPAGGSGNVKIKAAIEKKIIERDSFKTASEKARELRSALVAGKDNTPEKIIEAAKKAGCAVSAPETRSPLQESSAMLQSMSSADMKDNPQYQAFREQIIAQGLLRHIFANNAYQGYISEPAPENDNTVKIEYYSECFALPDGSNNAELRSAVKKVLLGIKQQFAMRNFGMWIDKNIKSYMQMDRQDRAN